MSNLGNSVNPGVPLVATDQGFSQFAKNSGGPDIIYFEDDFFYDAPTGGISVPWSFNNNGSGSFQQLGTGTNPGIWQLGTASSTSTQIDIDRGTQSAGSNGGSVVLGSGFITIESIVQLPTLATSIDDYRFIWGLTTGLSAYGSFPPTDGVYMWYERSNSLNWVGVTRASSTSTNVTSSTAVTTSFIRLRIDVNAAASLVTFYVNGVSIGTSSTHIPTQALGFLFWLEKKAGTNNRTLNIDYMSFYNRLTTSRF